MKAKLIVLCLFVGFLVTLAVGNAAKSLYINPVDFDRLGLGLCMGIFTPQDVPIELTIGLPLKWHSEQTTREMSNCTGGYEMEPALEEVLLPYLESWQFYVNWTLYSLPLFGISYFLINSRNKSMNVK